MNLENIRQDFPLLSENGKGKKIIYFDNACQSLRPKPVIEAVNEYYTKLSACSGRSMHHLAAEVTDGIERARTAVARLIGAARKEEIVFTRNTTEGINLVANSFDLKAGDLILVSDKEQSPTLKIVAKGLS